MLKRCLLFTENTYFFSERISMCEIMSLKKKCQRFYFPWTVICYLWCLQSKVPKRSHPNKLLTSVSLDTFLISLMASTLKRAKHFQNKREHCDEKRCMFVYQMSKLDYLGGILFLPKLWSNLTFYIAKGFSRILLYLNFDFKPSAFDLQWNWMVTKIIKNLSKRCKKT